jgi:hypothetical protein
MRDDHENPSLRSADPPQLSQKPPRPFRLLQTVTDDQPIKQTIPKRKTLLIDEGAGATVVCRPADNTLGIWRSRHHSPRLGPKRLEEAIGMPIPQNVKIPDVWP